LVVAANTRYLVALWTCLMTTVNDEDVAWETLRPLGIETGPTAALAAGTPRQQAASRADPTAAEVHRGRILTITQSAFTGPARITHPG
jgi:hypothetical protein